MRKSRLLVFCWHNVEGTPFFPAAPEAGTRGLEAQLRFLRRVATPVPLGAALRDLSAGRPLPRRAVAVTFDDGYRDNLDVAAPLLSRLGVPATFFLVPGLLSNTIGAWWEEVAWAFQNSSRSSVQWEGRTWEWDTQATRRDCCNSIVEALKRRNRSAREAAIAQLVAELEPAGPSPERLFMDWDGGRSLAGLGFEVGSHTLAHAILSEEEPAEQRRDLAESRRLLQEGIGGPIDLLAYPNGTKLDYDKNTLAAARDAGYAHSVTVSEGWNDRNTPVHEIRRFVVFPERGAAGLGVVLKPALRRLRARRNAYASSSA